MFLYFLNALGQNFKIYILFRGYNVQHLEMKQFKRIISDLRWIHRLVLFCLALYSLWLVVLDLSHGDREWILDDQQNLAFVDVTTLFGEYIQKYHDKVKFRILPGYFMMFMKFASSFSLILGLLFVSINAITRAH